MGKGWILHSLGKNFEKYWVQTATDAKGFALSVAPPLAGPLLSHCCFILSSGYHQKCSDGYFPTYILMIILFPFLFCLPSNANLLSIWFYYKSIWYISSWLFIFSWPTTCSWACIWRLKRILKKAIYKQQHNVTNFYFRRMGSAFIIYLALFVFWNKLYIQ